MLPQNNTEKPFAVGSLIGLIFGFSPNDSNPTINSVFYIFFSKNYCRSKGGLEYYFRCMELSRLKLKRDILSSKQGLRQKNYLSNSRRDLVASCNFNEYILCLACIILLQSFSFTKFQHFR